jgi:hypothetical protein
LLVLGEAGTLERPAHPAPPGPREVVDPPVELLGSAGQRAALLALAGRPGSAEWRGSAERREVVERTRAQEFNADLYFAPRNSE